MGYIDHMVLKLVRLITVKGTLNKQHGEKRNTVKIEIMSK